MSKFDDRSLNYTKIVKADKVYYNNEFYSWMITVNFGKINYKFEIFISEESNFNDVSTAVYNLMFASVEIKESTVKKTKMSKGIAGKYLETPEEEEEEGGDEEPVEPMF